MKNSILFLITFSTYFLSAMDSDQQTIPIHDSYQRGGYYSSQHGNHIIKLMHEGKFVRALEELTAAHTRSTFNQQDLIALQSTIEKATPRTSWLPGLAWLSACSATSLIIILSRNCMENNDCSDQSNSLFLSSLSLVVGSTSGILARKSSKNYTEEFQRTQTTMLAKINDIRQKYALK